MKKAILILCLLVAIMKPVLGQRSIDMDNQPPSLLKKQLAESKNDTLKVKLQIALGHTLLRKTGEGNREIDSALDLSLQAVKIGRQLGYHQGIVSAILLRAACFGKKNLKDSSLSIARQALAYAQKENDNQGTAAAYATIAEQYSVTDPGEVRKRVEFYHQAIVILRKERASAQLALLLKREADLLFQLKQKEEAIKLLFEALNINKSVGNKAVQEIYCLIGRTSLDFADYTNSVKYLLLALKTAKEMHDSTLVLCGIYNSLAVTYITLGDYDRAIPYSVGALQIARRYKDTNDIGTVSMMLSTAYARTYRIMRSLAILDGVKKMAKDDRDLLIVMESYLINLVYARQFERAGRYAQEVIRLSGKMPPGDATLAPAYHYLVDYYIATAQHKEAAVYVDRYAAIVNKTKLPKAVMIIEKYYYKMDSVRGAFGPALGHYLAAQKIRDSINNVTKAYQLSLLHVENETEKKNADIDNLTKQAQIKDVQLERNRTIQKLIIAGSVLLLIMTALIYSRYRLKQRSTALLLLQKSEIDQQNISLQHLITDKNQLLGEKDQLLNEKDLLLKEVNHRVKNNLQIVMSILSSQSGHMQNEKAQEAILESQNRVQAIALIHDALYNTDKIAEITLSSYIPELIGSLDNSINKGRNKVLIKCDVDPVLLDVSQAIPLGIILNESVTNALKYAFPGDRTGEIMVIVKEVDGQIEMKISDNGVGLPPDFNLFKADSLGVTLIKGLTDQLKGTFDLHYSNGVAVTVKFPMEIAARTGN